MKLRKSRSAKPGVDARPRTPFYVDLDMCGGELFLEDFDLEEFCGVLQRVVPKLRIIPVLDRSQRAQNPDPTLVSEAAFNKAITQYCCACSITGCCGR